jgi:hypothetical protein
MRQVQKLNSTGKTHFHSQCRCFCTIGKSDILFCSIKNNQPIGVSDYQLSKAIPEKLKSTLPTIEEVEQD